MEQRFSNNIKGSFTNPNLPIDRLIDLIELTNFNQIQPIELDAEILVFNAKDIEDIAVRIYYEVSLAKELLKKNQAFFLNEFPYLQQKVEYYLSKNPGLAKNNIFNHFIEENYHLAVFALALFNEEEYVTILNTLFRQFYFEYRFTGYLSNLLYYEAIHFDKKTRTHNEKQQLLLDHPIEGIGKTQYLEEAVAENNTEYRSNMEIFDEHISDEQLFNAFEKLTNRQQHILYHAYVEGLKDVEIAKVLGVSQQTVSKTRKAALDGLKKYLEVRR